MKKFFVFVVLLVLVLVVWWFSGLYLIVNGLFKVIEQCDIVCLECYVDFLCVCSSLCVQFNDYLVCQVGLDVVVSLFGVFFYGFGDQFGGVVVEIMVILIGIGVMLQGYVLWKCGCNELQGGDVFGVIELVWLLKNVEYYFELFDCFVIDVDCGFGQLLLKVVLELQGLCWKVVDLQLGMLGSF